ncbi:response regulator, partial [Wenyingzhuangia sp. 1_MG-2023]|nr:response regulator [Wenyingzhuangia sp. 1_MG-2023]
LQALRDQSNLTPVIIVSASRDPADIQRAKQLGAMSFISKSSSGKKIIETIQDVLDGKLVYCTEIDAEQDLASLSDQQWASLHNLT